MIDPDAPAVFVVESPGKVRWFRQALGAYFSRCEVVATGGRIFDLPSPSSSEGAAVDRWALKTGEHIERLAAALIGAKTVLLGLDPDNEGDLAASQVAAIANPESTFYRVRMHALTENDLREGLLRLEPFTHQSHDAISDSYFNYLVGTQLNEGGEKYPIGRVTSPLLAAVANNEGQGWMLEGFSSDWYTATRLDEHQRVTQPGEGARIDVHEIDDSSAEFLNLGTLVMATHESYGLCPTETYAVAQALYEQGVVTYARTGSTAATDDRVGEAARVGELLGLALPGGGFSQGLQKHAHEAIVPAAVSQAMIERCARGAPSTVTDKVLQVILARTIGAMYRAHHGVRVSQAWAGGVRWRQETNRETGEALDPRTGLPKSCPLNPPSRLAACARVPKIVRLVQIAQERELCPPGRYVTASKKVARYVTSEFTLTPRGYDALHLCGRLAPRLLDPQVRSEIRRALHTETMSVAERLGLAFQAAELPRLADISKTALTPELIGDTLEPVHIGRSRQ